MRKLGSRSYKITQLVKPLPCFPAAFLPSLSCAISTLRFSQAPLLTIPWLAPRDLCLKCLCSPRSKFHLIPPRLAEVPPSPRSLLRPSVFLPLNFHLLYYCSSNLCRYHLVWGLCLVSPASPIKQNLPEGRDCVLFLFVFTAIPGRIERWPELDRGDGCIILWMY